jgi:hypothetical protein
MPVFRVHARDGDLRVYLSDEDQQPGETIETEDKSFVVVRRIGLPAGDLFAAVLEVQRDRREA